MALKGLKLWVAKTALKTIKAESLASTPTAKDASKSSAREIVTGLIKKLGLRFGDITSKDFEDPEYDLSGIQTAYDSDSYIRQGVDKYVDQIFKEGFGFFGRTPEIVDYLKLRLAYIAEATGIPTQQFLIDIVEDVVKFANVTIAKARMTDQAQLPPTVNVTGLNGLQPVVGYFCLNPATMKGKRDKNGTVLGWQQEVDGADKPVKFKKEDIIHIYYKRNKGNLFGTSFLIPVIEDVKALRQAEENVLKMMFRNIYPFFHVKVGSDDMPGQSGEISQAENDLSNMDVDGGVVTSNRVEIKAIASDKVINAEPYLRYMEDRVFTGLGVPAVMFGRGDTANRNTSDSMTSEMSDRISAIQTVVELFFNENIVKELLMEGGYDPVLNPDHVVEFKFIENDMDRKIKQETHAVYLYEHNSIDEDEMRKDIGRDPISNRAKMFQTLITQANEAQKAQVNAQYAPKPVAGGTVKKPVDGTKATNQKQKPTNQYGTKTSPKKMTNSEDSIDQICDEFLKEIAFNQDSVKTIEDFMAKDLGDITLNLHKHKMCNDLLHDIQVKSLSKNEIAISVELLSDRLEALKSSKKKGG